MPDRTFSKGLEGVIAAESTICRIDGVGGKLFYNGYSIEDLAEQGSFEEVTYLLLYGELPLAEQLTAFSRRMRAARGLGEQVLSMIRGFPRQAHPMELLQSVISYLSSSVEHRIEHSDTCNCRDTLHQVSQMASVVATHARMREGRDYVPPRDDLSHGANFLYMLRGEEPSALEGEIMDRCLTLHAEHGFNASTFTARVVASTKSTCYSSISSAIGSLYGSLHGGANERALVQLNEIGSAENVDAWVDRALGEKRKIMGMGHRVYKAKDPRATILEQDLGKLAAEKGETGTLKVLKALEAAVGKRMEAKGKDIYPNVDFFSGALYDLLGIPSIFFTPIFAMSRVAGWLAHILEQRVDNRLFRPKALYVGPEPRPFVPAGER
ncbi:MAG: citrate/2-methylcitrate synthase [Planctomycetota bacterium]|jgi:citrate synthase